ncbi:MAG TPA: Xaa-Pro peptidase family protein [Actinomycetota bacterium]|nr:Xaa-Pro peptidase family protein [Actinomycetota bacterium]
MTTFLLVDDAIRSLELRHEIGEAIMDPVTFIDHEGTRIVVASDLEVSTLEKREDVIDEVWNAAELGREDLMRSGHFPLELIPAELTVRALERLGVFSVSVPPSFGVQIADYLRDKGVEVAVDAGAWIERRRRKTPAEIEGIERAQRATETAMLTAARMLREAELTSSGQLRFEGEVLTSELIRTAMEADLLSQGAEPGEILVQSGDACLRGHELGSGPILPDQSCIIDCFPMDRRTGAYTDMTRTFVPGTPSPALRRLYDACRKALDIALSALRPGAADVYDQVANFFNTEGFPTRLHHSGSEPLREGFFHALGHGVGLEVHEPPFVGRGGEPLVAGDVLAIEPGLYTPDFGGCCIEELVLVTDDGCELLSGYPRDLTP